MITNLLLKQPSESVGAVIKLLKLLKIKVTDDSVYATVCTHSDYPSLLCISDSLNKWNVPNAAGRIDTKAIEQLSTPVLVTTKNDYGTSYEIISEISDNTVVSFLPGKKHPTIIEKCDFINKWTGVYLIADKRDNSGEFNYKKKKRITFVKQILPILLLMLVSLFLFFTFLRNSIMVLHGYLFVVCAQYLIMIVGTYVSGLLLWQEIDQNNPWINKVCSAIPQGSCRSVLNSKYAHPLSWISWSEVGLFYYLGSLLLVSCSTFYLYSLFVIGWLSLVCLPYVFYSIIYQWKIIKKWCILCLIIQMLILLGGINVLLNSNVFLQVNLISDSITWFCLQVTFFYLFPFLLWLYVKPFVLTYFVNLQQIIENKRFKFNPKVFDAILYQQKKVDMPDDIGIKIGSEHPKHVLTKVCNPYCGPCSRMHPKMEKLIKETQDLQVRIIFTTPNNKLNMAYSIVSHFLTLYKINKVELCPAMDDWYSMKEKDYDLFQKKHPISSETNNSIEIEKMSKWCEQIPINGTPTVFIDGYQLPNMYEVEDLSYFLYE